MHSFSFLLSLLLTALFFCFSGCISHPEKISKFKKDLAYGRMPDQAFLAKPIDPESTNGLLLLLERTRLQQLLGNTQLSSSDFLRAHEYHRKQEENKPMLAFSDLLNQAGAILINDQSLPYRIKHFEEIMLYQLQIFNSMIDQPENLPPLINNLTAIQQRVRNEYADSIQKAEQALQNSSNQDAGTSWQLIRDNPQFQRNTAENMQLAGKLSSFENAYAYYFCAVFFENQGKFGDAFLAYESALRLQPANQTFQNDVARIGGLLNKTEELQKYNLSPLTTKIPDGHGEVVLFFEEGYIPAMHSFKLPPIPIPTGYGLLLINLALPYYLPANSQSSPAKITFPGGSVQTELAADLRNLAVKALSDKLPEITTRMALRAITRAAGNYAMLKSAKNISDPGQREAAIFFLHLQQIFMHIVEEPDLRSWLLLPNFTQVARFSLPEGTQQITLHYQNIQQTMRINVVKGRTSIAHCMAVPGRLTFSSALLPASGWK